MALRFNTFRSERYLRSRFVEGRYLLASEATDLELESLGNVRKHAYNQFGNVAIADAWKVEWLNPFQLSVKPGLAWYQGLPFELRGSSDQLVSGSILALGVVPAGVTIVDDATGLGKILTFNDGAITPSNTYSIIISAREELITDVEDPFLKNANITESTAQKVRLNYQLNIVPSALQEDSPIPYRDESSSSLVVTNFPNVGSTASPNLKDYVVVTPTAAGNGELISLTPVSGSEVIDGRDLELVVRNDSGIGGGIVLPNGNTAQQAFSNGKLVDSNGNEYHINLITNDVINTQLLIRIDKEPGQPNPEIINTKPYTLKKRDVYVTDDLNGAPQGKLYWLTTSAEYDQVDGFTHASKIVDLRVSIQKQQESQELTNVKSNLIPTGGQNITFNQDSDLSWQNDFTIVNAFGTNNTVSAGNAYMPENYSLVYELDLTALVDIARGQLGTNVTAATPMTNTLELLGEDLSQVKLGNLIVVGSEFASITAVDDINKILTLATPISNVGGANIYYDVYANGTYTITPTSYVLATRINNKVQFANGVLELELGETNQLGDGITQAILDFLGASDENDDNPIYPSTNYVSNGSSLVTAIGDLDVQTKLNTDKLDTLSFDESQYFALGVTAGTTITIPNSNSFLSAQAKDVHVIVNGINREITRDFTVVGVGPLYTQIQFIYDLPIDSVIRFKKQLFQ